MTERNKPRQVATRAVAGRKVASEAAAVPRLLSGGNPQIPKGYGDELVQSYIAAMPGWKRELGERLDAAIMKAAPKATKAVKYNQPLYGTGNDIWFVSFRCFTKCVKLTFFAGARFDSPPPGAGKDPNARWLDIYETDVLDEVRIGSWVRQAVKLPGEKL